MATLSEQMDEEYMTELEGKLAKAAARIEALEEAIKPFAEIEHSKYEPDDGPAFIEGVIQRLPTVGDLRRAARAYANKGEQTLKSPAYSEAHVNKTGLFRYVC